MQKGNKAVGIIIAIIVIAVLAVGVVFMLMSQKSAAPQPTNTSGDSSATEPASKTNDDDKAASVTIVYTDNGFDPTSYTVKAGSAVKVENKSSNPLQFSSANHPTHTQETELNLATLEPGESAAFTPTKTGTWGFHDHLNAANTGTLTVE